MITFDQIYSICKKYAVRKSKSAAGTKYINATPKICAEKIMELIENENSFKKMSAGFKACEVCGKLTDGYVRVLFWKTYYCREHFPLCSNVKI